jgi:hypothetical protein
MSVSLDPVRSIGLASDLQETDMKTAATSRLQTLDSDLFYAGIQALEQWWDDA